MITADDTEVSEDGGMALVIVRLVNEIEGDFTLDYATGQVADGASGTYMCTRVYVCLWRITVLVTAYSCRR